jgi:Flp pilus assembly protein TadG
MRTFSQFIVARVRGLMRSKSEGGALVEIAVTLPIIFLIMTGIFAFSIALYQKLQLAEAVSAGGRFLAADRGDTDPCKSTGAAVASAAPGLTAGNIKVTMVLNGVASATNVASGSATCAGTSGAAKANMVSGASASLTATYACTVKMYGFSFPNCSLGSAVTEEVQ